MAVTEAERLPCDLDPEFLSLSVGSGIGGMRSLCSKNPRQEVTIEESVLVPDPWTSLSERLRQ